MKNEQAIRDAFHREYGRDASIEMKSRKKVWVDGDTFRWEWETDTHICYICDTATQIIVTK